MNDDPEFCFWKYEGDDNWSTSCGATYHWTSVDILLCPSCGKTIVTYTVGEFPKTLTWHEGAPQT